MTLLVAGLILFFGAHSISIVAPGWRDAAAARLGENAWKGLYSLVAVAGLALLIHGYGLARAQPVVLYQPPAGLRHAALLLMLPVFPLLLATYLPGRIRRAAKHPMLVATKLWALAHLLANGTLADLLLFGGFLLWAVLAFRAARQRDRATHATYPPGTAGGTVLTVVVGVVLWAAFAFWLHGWWIGVRPFG